MAADQTLHRQSGGGPNSAPPVALEIEANFEPHIQFRTQRKVRIRNGRRRFKALQPLGAFAHFSLFARKRAKSDVHAMVHAKWPLLESREGGTPPRPPSI